MERPQKGSLIEWQIFEVFDDQNPGFGIPQLEKKIIISCMPLLPQ